MKTFFSCFFSETSAAGCFRGGLFDGDHDVRRKRGYGHHHHHQVCSQGHKLRTTSAAARWRPCIRSRSSRQGLLSKNRKPTSNRLVLPPPFFLASPEVRPKSCLGFKAQTPSNFMGQFKKRSHINFGVRTVKGQDSGQVKCAPRTTKLSIFTLENSFSNG